MIHGMIEVWLTMAYWLGVQGLASGLLNGKLTIYCAYLTTLRQFLVDCLASCIADLQVLE